MPLRLFAAVGLVLGAVLPGPASAAIDLQLLVGGLARPVSIANAGDGSGRLFIVEQAGRVHVYDGTQLLATPFLDISSLVVSIGEQGLLDVAFHPLGGHPKPAISGQLKTGHFR